MESIKPPDIVENEWSQYSLLRDSGVKKSAATALSVLIEKIEKCSNAEVDDFLLGLCDREINNKYCGVIQHPLFVKCILPMLEKGFREQSPREMVLLARFSEGIFSNAVHSVFAYLEPREIYRKVLEIDPLHVEAFNLLVGEYIRYLDYGAHHLPDSLIINLSDAQKNLRECAQIILASQHRVSPTLLEKYKHLSSLYGHYERWSLSCRNMDFADWCKMHNVPI